MTRHKARSTVAEPTAVKVGCEAQLGQTAHALRDSVDSVDRNVGLACVFLNYVNNALDGQHNRLEVDPEDLDGYFEKNIFWVAPEAPWSHLSARVEYPPVEDMIADIEGAVPRFLWHLPGTA